VQRPTVVWLAGLARHAPVGLGLAFGMYFVLTSPYLHAPLWSVWAPLLVASTTTAGAVWLYGLGRWAELSRPWRVAVRDVAPRVAAIEGLALLVVLGSILLGSSWRHVALLSVLLLGAAPAAASMEGVRHLAGKDSLFGASRTKGELIMALGSLRGLLQRLLGALGSVVALSTLAVGAAAALERLPASSRGGALQLPPQFVLIFGGAGSLLVGVLYVPAAAALQRRGQRLCDELFPLRDADDASAILRLADDRHKLEQLLGVDRSVVADLQTGLAILGPLLASAATAFLSP
jgi:hypothetical protein